SCHLLGTSIIHSDIVTLPLHDPLPISGSGTVTRTVTISGITGDGILSISIAADSARDPLNGPAPAAGPSPSVEVDNTPPSVTIRSEEHTSELQSRENLVCRLQLEKKKQ